MGYLEFYHYTNENGKNAILNSLLIKESNHKVGDAVFGKGVYGNGLPPDEFSKEELAENNYDSHPGFWEQLLDVGKVDYAIRITLPSSKVKRIKHDTRNILLHKGNIDLRLYDYEVLEVPDYDSSDSDSDCDSDSEYDTD